MTNKSKSTQKIKPKDGKPSTVVSRFQPASGKVLKLKPTVDELRRASESN